ncbi:MAG: Na+:solute symporter [Gammaproteobacteria bacterium]|nr:MAG: Na+:solute symporter [Gammaproteobacteria bacterium]RLA37005.1 MAG: Na+:solute symporter [Gammaproteobacteria bacterium]
MVRLDTLDWIIVAVILGISLSIGVLVSRRAGASSSSFFLSGRSMPWWLLGTSMVATTFSTDTPNLVAEIVRTNGVSGNWIWWAFLITGMFTCFLYARMWRRSGAMTDLEFYELRYSGGASTFLRVFRALYLGVFFNIMTMALVSLAAIKIAAVMLGFSPIQTLLIAGTVTLIFSTLGGFLGVVLTDLILFVISMTGAILAATVALNLPEVNGLQNLLSHPDVASKLSFIPDFSNMEVALAVFIIPLAVQWWSVWYPGAEPGGGGYVAQRMLAARNERDAVGAVLLFQVAHYAIRPWPWILVALASIVVFPDLDSIRVAFPHVDSKVVGHDMAYPAMLTFLPSGLLGFVFASLIAAYMSTMSSQLNWGASYVVNDVYKRFISPDAGEKRLVLVGRLATVVLMIAAGMFALFLESALQAFHILLSVGAGTGLLFLLRWFWWRINAASEIVAMVVSFFAALYFQFADLPGWSPYLKLISGIAVTTVAWVLAAYLGPRTKTEVLEKFCRELRPQGPGWSAVRKHMPASFEGEADDNISDNIPAALLNVFVGCLSVYAMLFGVGYTVYGNYVAAVALLLVGSVGIGFLVHNLRRVPG